MNNWGEQSPLEQWRSIRAAASVDGSQCKCEDNDRAAANIKQWREFLPAECVEAMLKQGWHRRV